MDLAIRSISIKSTPVPISMLITLPWADPQSCRHTRRVTRMPDGGTCPAVEDHLYKADQDIRRGILKVPPRQDWITDITETPMSDTQNKDVLYLTALLSE